MSHKGTDNLIPGDKRTQEEARENGRKGGKRSGEVRREKKTFKECLKIMMDETAPEKIRAAFDKNGYDVTTHREAITAAILMGAMQGNPKMVDKALELLGEDYRKAAREAEIQIQKERFELEKAKADLEAEKAKVWMEAVKSQQEAEMEDDGFLDALKGTATEDWDNEDNPEGTVSL